MGILLVEDNIELSQAIQTYLESNRFSVQKCDRKDDIDYFLDYYTFELILLDIQLPDSNGFEIIQEIRKKQNHIPILVISALSELDNRIKGLNLGADDYLPKPFDMGELLARINALLRRRTGLSTNQLVYKSLTLDIDKGEVYRDEQLIALRPKELQLLEYMMRNQGLILSRAKILNQVWDIEADFDSNTVDVHIRNLRKKIDIPFDMGYIKTIKGMGYVLK